MFLPTYFLIWLRFILAGDIGALGWWDLFINFGYDNAISHFPSLLTGF